MARSGYDYPPLCPVRLALKDQMFALISEPRVTTLQRATSDAYSVQTCLCSKSREAFMQRVEQRDRKPKHCGCRGLCHRGRVFVGNSTLEVDWNLSQLMRQLETMIGESF